MVHRSVTLAFLVIFVLMGGGTAQQPFTVATEVVVEVDVLRVRSGPGLSTPVVGRQERGPRGVVADASPYWVDGSGGGTSRVPTGFAGGRPMAVRR